MSCLVAREYVLPIRTYHWNSRLQSNRGLIQRFLSYFLAQLHNVDFANLGERARRGGKIKTRVPRVTGPLSLKTHQTLNDFHALRKLTNRPIKMTLPGPCTLVDGAADHFYGDERTLALAFADALNVEMRALAAAGCDMVQIDEPSITRLPEQVHTWGIEAMDRAFAGVNIKTCVHVCYGYRSRQAKKEWKHGYDEILPALAKGSAQQYSLEFAEPDLPAKILDMLPNKIIQLGVIDVGRETIETPAVVEKRLRAALEVVPAARLVAAPDCGCGALPREVARGKLHALAAGAREVRAHLAR
ncbi:MAG: hypothetical protein FJY56_22225 [Betaproteobacteria bacterium]|nr:hypothetical protein [Betaproteobacteria bacterium]